MTFVLVSTVVMALNTMQGLKVICEKEWGRGNIHQKLQKDRILYQLPATKHWDWDLKINYFNENEFCDY